MRGGDDHLLVEDQRTGQRAGAQNPRLAVLAVRVAAQRVCRSHAVRAHTATSLEYIDLPGVQLGARTIGTVRRRARTRYDERWVRREPLVPRRAAS